MVSFMNHGINREADAWNKFDEVFGKAGIQHEETYFDPMRGIDKRAEIGKALLASGSLTKAPSLDSTSGGSYTAQGLIPAFVDPQVVDRSVRETPLVRMLARRAVRSLKYVYNDLSTKAGASFLAEDASLAEDVDTRGTTTVDMKFLYAVGRVTGPAQSGAQAFINLLSEDIRVKTQSMNEALENEIINGPSANGFDGLITDITTNSVANGGAEITLQDMRDDMNSAFETGGATGTGLIDLIVTDGRTHNYIKGLLFDIQRNVERPSGVMDFGIPDAYMWDGALVIRNRFMPTTPGSRRILYLDTRFVWLAVLQDTTFFELAKTNDSDKYALKWYGSLVVSAENHQAQRSALA